MGTFLRHSVYMFFRGFSYLSMYVSRPRSDLVETFNITILIITLHSELFFELDDGKEGTCRGRWKAI